MARDPFAGVDRKRAEDREKELQKLYFGRPEQSTSAPSKPKKNNLQNTKEVETFMEGLRKKRGWK